MNKSILLLLISFNFANVFGQGFENFITAEGHKLMDGDEVYRFISFNIPNLNYTEDEMGFDVLDPYALPTEFEMRDAFETVRQMGGQSVRIYTIPVRNTNFPESSPTYVEGPGEFNEEAFVALDMMMALANEYGIRVLIPFVNNWEWMGGAPNYADFRNKEFDDFWVDHQLVSDFKETIEFVINRTNTVTGVKYKDDKAILGWETGNELLAPFAWTKEITCYIKSLDSNHLVWDGYYAVDGRPVLPEAIQEPCIDVVSSHHYELNPFEIIPNIEKNLEIVDGKKPYVLGEFGFSSTASINHILDDLISNDHISGAWIWSLRFRRESGGFYWHSEPLGSGLYKSYHWPGSETGRAYNERALMEMYRQKAFEIQDIETPEISIPSTPTLLPIKDVYAISWQGSVGAIGYNIYRSTDNENWLMIASNVSEKEVQYAPLFNDKTAEIGSSYFYKISAFNGVGESEGSNVVGPIKVERKAIVDHMQNFGNTYEVRNVEVTTGNDRTYKEDLYRIKGVYGSEMYYRIPGTLEEFRVYAFEEQNWWQLKFEVSEDGQNWENVFPPNKAFGSDDLLYAYWTPRLYTIDGKGKNYQYVKIFFNSNVQISRVEAIYK